MQNKQLSDVKGKELVAAGHALANALGMDTPLIEIAKMMAELATRLDCSLVRSDELEAQRDALATENGLAAKAVQTFCDVVGSNTDVIAEEMGIEGAKAILAAMSATGNMPATDAYLSSVRAEGVEMFAHFWEINCGHEKTFIGSEAKAFAAQLSAGKDGE